MHGVTNLVGTQGGSDALGVATFEDRAGCTVAEAVESNVDCEIARYDCAIVR